MADKEKKGRCNVYSKYMTACSDGTIISRCIFACDRNGIIGYNNDLIFHNKKDLAFFKMKTMGGIVVMGHNTFRSMKSRPLPGRVNLVMTRERYPLFGVPRSKKPYFWEGALPKDTYFAIITAPDMIVDYAEKFNIKNVWIIGGAGMFDLFFNRCNSTVETVYNCDLLEEGVRLGFLPPDYDPSKLVRTEYGQLMKKEAAVVSSDYFVAPNGETIKYSIKSRVVHVTKQQQAAQKAIAKSERQSFASIANSTNIKE